MLNLQLNYRILVTAMVITAMMMMNDAFGQVVCSTCNLTGCSNGALATGACSFAACENSNATGDGASALSGGQASGDNATALSQGEASGEGSTAGTNGTASGEKSTAFGLRSYATGAGSVVLGEDSYSDGVQSVAIGSSVRSTTGYTANHVIGQGVNPSNRLTNGISSSLMIGYNSTVSTIFVESSSGAGTYGNVGIGNITDPESLLHVRNQVRLGVASANSGSIVFNNSTNTNTLTINTGVTSTSHAWTLPTTQGANTHVLTNNGSGVLTWAAPVTTATAWQLLGNSGTNPNTPTFNFLGTTDAVDLVFRTNNTEKMRVMAGGNVGIGTATPDGILHLLALSSTDTDLIIEKADAREGALIFDNNGTQSASIAYNSGEQMILENTIANNEIRFRVSNGTVTEVMTVDGADLSVGIGVSNPESKLHVDADDASSATETVALFTVGENTIERFVLRNNSTTNGAFAPMMGSVSRQTNDPAMLIQAEVDNGNDTGTEPAMTFQVRNDATTFTTRPLFRWEEPNTVRMQMNAGGNLGIGTTSPSGRLHVNGTVFVNYASVPAASFSDEDLGINPSNGQVVNLSTSSIHFKNHIENIEFDKEAFLNLRPVDYNWKEFYGGHSDVGLIAQEVAETFPPLASWSHRYTHLENGDLMRDSTGIPVVDTTQLEVSGVRYHKLPVYLLAIAKDQQNEISELRLQLQELTERLDGCCAEVGAMHRFSGEDPQQLAKTESFDEFVLLQNDPNPFRDYTDIQYEHDGCVTCEIIISDLSGRILKRIKTNGSKGVVRLYSSEIGSGLFLYSLVKDGQTVRSERMVSSNR